MTAANQQLHHHNQMSTYVGNKYVCERPNEGILFLVPLSQPLAKLDMSVKDAILDDL